VSHPARTRRTDHGMVTVEAAVALPALLLVLALAVGVISTVGAQLRLVDAARQAARLAARGEPADVVAEVGERAGPRGTTVTIRRDGSRLTVTTRATTRPLGLLPGIGLQAKAVAESEAP